MSPNAAETQMKAIWKNQAVDRLDISLDRLRADAKKFHGRILIRNAAEYIASLLVVVAFGALFFHSRDVWVRASCALIVMATVFVVQYLYRHGSPREVSADAGLQNCLTFTRSELVRQRDLLRGVWRWYIAPFVPGMLVLLLAGGGRSPAKWVGVFLAIAVVSGVFVGVGFLNRLAARRLQNWIDALDEMQAGK